MAIQRGNMQFLNLKRIYERNKKSIDRNINDVLSSGRFIGGKYVEELEMRLSQYTNSMCATCANGTDALHIAIRFLHLHLEGKKIALPAFGFKAALEMINLVGAQPVFVDIGDDFNINPDLIPDDIDGVIAMSLFGVDCKYEEIRKKIGWKKKFIIDAAQSFSSSIGKQAMVADIITTSFHPAKLLGCFGDGGALFTKQTDGKDFAKTFCNHGRFHINDRYLLNDGINSRLDNIQAAILCARFETFEDELWKREVIAEKYGIQKVGNRKLFPYYSILVNNRDKIRKSIEERGVPTKCYYSTPLFHWDWKTLHNSPIIFKNTEAISKRILQVPIDPYMTDKEIKKVKEIVSDYPIR